MKLANLLIAAACIGSLSACQKEVNDDRADAAWKEVNEKTAQMADLCQATKVSDYVGLDPTAETKQKIAEATGNREVRYLTATNPPSADRDNNRLNVDLDPDGRIDMFWCG